VHEHVEYFPYGEVWRDPRSDSDGGPVKGQRFLFTGKELDEETGLVYFGARYYQPARARWVSTDPALGSFIPSNDGEASRLPADGVFRGQNASIYSYAMWRPLNMVDPDGAWPWNVHLKETKALAVADGRYSQAAADVVAMGNARVDKEFGGYGFIPVLGSPGYHFNTNYLRVFGDSRAEKAQFHFNYAVARGRAAAGMFAQARLVADQNSRGFLLREAASAAREAFDQLGVSMHPVGDYYSHQPYEYRFLGILQKQHDSPGFWLGNGPNLADDASADDPRRVMTRAAWKTMLERYAAALGTHGFADVVRALEEGKTQ
jgi:RHS repeat-associated protein